MFLTINIILKKKIEIFHPWNFITKTISLQ